MYISNDKRIKKMNELAWVLGIVLCALGVALSTKANFGLSMIAAPPYIVHVKLAQILPWYTQGTSEYIWQGFLFLVMLIIVRRFKVKYILSFITAILFGLTLDVWLAVLGGGAPYEQLWLRITIYILSQIISTLSIAFFFRTSLPTEIYELFVIEIAEKFRLDPSRVKLFYDIAMLAMGIILTFLLHGELIGIGIGTVITTVINAPLISLFGKLLDKIFVFDARFQKLVDFCQK